MATVILSGPAQRSLAETLIYISEDNPKAAVDLILDLEKRLVGTLGLFPEAGVKWRGTRRVMTIRRYAFVYRYDATKDEVLVLDVFGPGMDWR